VRRSFGGGWWDAATGTLLGRCGRRGGADLLRRTLAAGVVAPGESPSQTHSGGMAAAPSGVALPAEGAIFERQSCCTRFLGENPVQLLDERRRRLRAS
jgi:hypothetical protein